MVWGLGGLSRSLWVGQIAARSGPLWEKLWEIVFWSDSRKLAPSRRFGPKASGLSRETLAALRRQKVGEAFF